MAAGEYVSQSSQQADTERADLKLELKDLRADSAGEHKELTAIHVRRGLDPLLAKQVARQLRLMTPWARMPAMNSALPRRSVRAPFKLHGVGSGLRHRSGVAFRSHGRGPAGEFDSYGFWERVFAGRSSRHLLGRAGHGNRRQGGATTGA